MPSPAHVRVHGLCPGKQLLVAGCFPPVQQAGRRQHRRAGANREGVLRSDTKLLDFRERLRVPGSVRACRRRWESEGLPPGFIAANGTVSTRACWSLVTMPPVLEQYCRRKVSGSTPMISAGPIASSVSKPSNSRMAKSFMLTPVPCSDSAPSPRFRDFPGSWPRRRPGIPRARKTRGRHGCPAAPTARRAGRRRPEWQRAYASS